LSARGTGTQFMFKQTREKDIQLFMELNNSPQLRRLKIFQPLPFPCVCHHELRTAFTMGFVIYIHFDY
jgi:flagellar biosynthetic protein FliP